MITCDACETEVKHENARLLQIAEVAVERGVPERGTILTVHVLCKPCMREVRIPRIP